MRLTGHIRPLLPYAHALQSGGHEVLVSTPASGGAVVRDAGLAHAVAGFPDEEDLREIWDSLPKMSREEALETILAELFAGRYPQAALPALRETIGSWKPDLIVRESMEFGAVIAAAQAAVPVVRVNTTNAEFEAWVLRRAVGPVDRLRQESGLPPDQGAALRAAPALTSFPPSLDGDPRSAAPKAPFRVRMEPERLDPDSAVPPWAHDDGRPLLFITLGTLAAASPKSPALYRAALDAVAAMPVRVLLSTGVEMDDGALGAIPENVTVVSWVAQAEIYPRAAALLCHGGAGTVLAALTHGLPMVVTPLGADQPVTARLVEATGAGIALADPDASSLRAGLERALRDADMREAAGGIAREIAAMPSMGAAVQELERLAAR
jgi:UDP:flavonoid glycosyltransferase YjiC (YdhE family)